MKAKAKTITGTLMIAATLVGLTYGVISYMHAQRISVLLITLDTTRADRLGCYGYDKADTPVLDKIAETGVRFDRAYCNLPLTLPAHTTMMTGLYPPEHGVRVNGMHRLGNKFPTMAGVFQKHGYDTAAFIAAFVLDKRFGLARGFNLYDDYEVPESDDPYEQNNMYKYRRGNKVAEAAMKWFESRKNKKPFFAWVHLYDPHQPYYYKNDPYDKEIRFMDKQIGKILGYLKKNGMLDKTMVVIVGDHGEQLGEHGEQEHGLLLHNAGTHVPLIVRLPGKIPEGKTSDAWVTHVDLFPTIADILGWKIPGRTSGRSFAKLLGMKNAAEWENHPIYCETEFPLTEYGWSPLYSVIYEDWKYIKGPKPELYDLAVDFSETNNLAAGKADRMDDLSAELEALANAMVVAKQEKIQLDRASQEALESLGYLGGGGGATKEDKDLLNPADVIHLKLDFSKAMGLEKMKKYDEAETLLQRMITESPKSFVFQYKLATMLYRQQKWQESCDQYEKVAKLYPDKYKTHYTFGTALIRIKKYERAVEELRLAQKLAPGQLPCYNNLGIALLKSGEVYEAIEVFQESIGLKYDQKDPHNNLGSAFLKLQKMDEAEKAFRAAIKIDEEFVDAHFNLGLVLLGKKKAKEAVQEFRRTLQLQPNHPGAKARLQMIQSGVRPPHEVRPMVPLREPDVPAAKRGI